MVNAVWEVRRWPKVTVADVQVTQSFDILVIVDAVVTGLAWLKAIGGGHFRHGAVSNVAECAVNRITVECDTDDVRRGVRCVIPRPLIVQPCFTFFGMPMHAIPVCMVMVRSTWTAVAMAKTQPYLLAIFLIDAMMRGHCVSSRAVLRSVNGDAIQRKRHFATFGRARERTVCFWTIGGIMATCRVVHRCSWNQDGVVLCGGTTTRAGFKVMIGQAVHRQTHVVLNNGDADFTDMCIVFCGVEVVDSRARTVLAEEDVHPKFSEVACVILLADFIITAVWNPVIVFVNAVIMTFAHVEII